MMKIKVFFIINCFSAGGGAEAVLTSIVNNLDREKYVIGLMEIIHSDVKQEPIKDDIKVYPFYTLADAPNRKERMYYVYHEWNKVINEYIPSDYDVYISFNYLKPSFLLPPDKKSIAWIHGDVYNLLEDRFKEERQLQNLAFNKADKIVVISDNTEKSVLDLYPNHKDKIVKIYNSIDAERVLELAKCECDITLEKDAIICVGRLDDNKNPFRAIDVYEKVLEEKPSAKLYFLGYGNLESQVKEIIHNKRYENNIYVLGYYENPFPIMKQAKVMLMLSKSEGYSLAISESICLGVPVVSTRAGAAERQINCEKNGVVIATNEEAVAALLKYLNKEPDINNKLLMANSERDKFENYIIQIQKLIDEINEK